MHNAGFYYKTARANLDSVHLNPAETVDRVTLGMTLKRIDKLLNSGSADPLDNLVRRAQEMDRVLQLVRDALPEIDPREIESANLRDDGELVVVCRNSAWASRIRFEGDRIVTAARRQGFAASACRVRVGR